MPQRQRLLAPTQAIAGLAISMLLVSVTIGMGCKGGETPSDASTAQGSSAEQDAIREYSSHVAKVDEKQEAFRIALRRALSQCQADCDIDAHKKAFEDEVLKAFEAYHKALRDMPTGTKRLSEIHRIIVKAYAASGETLKKYPDGLTARNTEERRIAYINSFFSEIGPSEDEYKRAIAEYFSSVPGVKFKASPTP